MMTLALTCLGNFQITLGDEPLTAFPTDKVQALLVYLMVEGRVHTRSELMQLLWPGYTTESASNNLRQALHRLRNLLGEDEQTPWLLTTRQTVQINPAAPIHSDVTTFTGLLAECATHAHAQLADCSPCLARLQQAVDRYQGDFLAGFTIADSNGFEEWRQVTQEQLHLAALDALAQLAAAAEAVGDDEGALQYARRQLALEPWLEIAHRRVMRSLAGRGQRAAALAHYQHCRQILAEELGAEPEAETTALYEEIQRGEFETRRHETRDTRHETRDTRLVEEVRMQSAAPVSLSPSLPVFPSSFVGRARELAEISSRLATTRLLTLVGPGGMGKTRLAVEVGREQQVAFADGVCFVPLAPINSVDALAPAIAHALGLTLQGSDLRSLLCQLLRQKRLLLILDNFEHLLAGDAVDLVVNLLAVAPGVQILVTSRERLKLQSEQLYQVQALTFATKATLAEAEAFAAVRLFVQSVQRIQPAFQLTAANLAAVLRICHLVQGMPLGLELAAANAYGAPLSAIADAIAQSAEILSVDWRDLPARQRNMRAVFDWSWRLLLEAEQRLLRQSAIFRGGFDYAAAQAVLGATLPLLSRLVDKSLLQWQATAGEGRYTLHELLRQFAAEHLAQIVPEQEAVAARHCAFYLHYLAVREKRLTRAEPRAAAAEIQVELDNIRQAWQSAGERRDFAALHQSAWAFFSFYRHTGALAEARQAFQAVVDQISLPAGPDFICEQPPPAPPRSRLLAIYAYLLVFQNKFDQAIEVVQQALALAQAEGVTDAAALSQLSWGQTLRAHGRLAEAQFHLEQSLQIIRLATDPTATSELRYDVECLAELWLGTVNIDWRRYHQARTPMQRSLQLAQSLRKRRMEMIVLINLATLACFAGDYPVAQQGYEESLRLARALDYRWGEGTSQYELGYVLRLQGAYSRALPLVETAVTIFAEIGEHSRQASALITLCQIYAYLGDVSSAEEWLTRYQQLSGQIKGAFDGLHYLQARTVLALHRGEARQALAYATEGWQLAQQGHPPDLQAYLLIGMGHAQRQLGELAAAATAYQQALEQYRASERSDLAAEAQASLAALAQQQGDLPQALALVEAVLAQLAQRPTSGLDEPFFLYLTCYQVLAATQDPRAPTILQQGYTLLQRYADQITDARLRQSFLTTVPVHRALQQAYTDFPANAPRTVDSLTR